LNVPNHHQEKYPQAIELLDRCAQFLNEAGLSNKIITSIKAEELKVRDLLATITRMKYFLALVQESCFELLGGADSSIKPEVKVWDRFLLKFNVTELIISRAYWKSWLSQN
jgi:hypothetical protein